VLFIIDFDIGILELDFLKFLM